MRERARALLRPRSLVVVGLVLALLGGVYQFWFRDSSFVAVEAVAVEGIGGPEREAATQALTEAALEMTTLHVDQAALDAAVATLPTVVGVSAQTDFPHALTLTVQERPPVVLLEGPDGAVPAAGDGTVLAGVATDGLSLPVAEVPDTPAGGKLEGDALEIARVMGAAPGPLRKLVEDVSAGGSEGVTAELRGGIPVYFGGSDKAGVKWAAAAAVLADPKIDALTYLDVRVPERPAVGGAAPPAAGETAVP